MKKKYFSTHKVDIIYTPHRYALYKAYHGDTLAREIMQYDLPLTEVLTMVRSMVETYHIFQNSADMLAYLSAEAALHLPRRIIWNKRHTNTFSTTLLAVNLAQRLWKLNH